MISDGALMAENLALVKKDASWVHRVLREKDATLQSTWLLTVDAEDKIVFYPKEDF